MSYCRALDHLILGPKFAPIPNVNKKIFFPNSRQKFPKFFCGPPSFFHIIQIQNILHICKINVNYSLLVYEEKFFRNIDDSVVFVLRTQTVFSRLTLEMTSRFVVYSQ